LSPDQSTKDWFERRRRIKEAKDRGDKEYLIGALLDPDHRDLAADFVGELHAGEASGQLIRLLDAADPHVRISAARALGRVGAVEALSRLREIAMHDEEDGVRSWAVGALGDIGDPEDVDLIVALLSDDSMRVRGAAALALGRMGDSRGSSPYAQRDGDCAGRRSSGTCTTRATTRRSLSSKMGRNYEAFRGRRHPAAATRAARSPRP
jgi:hypothetical protein